MNILGNYANLTSANLTQFRSFLMNLWWYKWHKCCINYHYFLCRRINNTHQTTILRFFLVSLCRSLTEIYIYLFGKTFFWFDSMFKTVTELLDTHDVLSFVWDSIHSTISSLNSFLMYYILSNLSLIPG